MPPDAANNLALSIGITGALNVEALEAAIGDLTARHASLRAFGTPGEATPSLQVVAAAPLAAMARMKEEETRGFQLGSELPFRAHLFTIAPKKHALSLVAHRSSLDAWSVPPLMRDLSLAYTARVQGMAPAWSEAGAAPGPPAVPQPDAWPVSPARWERMPVRLHPGLHQRLLEVAGARDALFPVLAAALARAIGRKRGADQVTIGTCDDGRIAGEAKVGAFARMHKIHVSLAGNPAFRETLDAVRAASPEPRPNGRCEASLTLRSGRFAPPDFPGLLTVLGPVTAAFGPSDANLDLCELRGAAGQPEGIEGLWEHDPGAFAAPEIFGLMLSELRDACSVPVPGATAVAYEPPHNTVQHLVAADWERRCGVGRIGIRDPFDELVRRPEDRARMLRELGTLLRCDLAAALPSGPLTVDRVGNTLLAHLALTPEAVCVQQGNPEERLPLFLFHGDLSGGYYAYPLARLLGREQPVFTIAPHGLDGQDVPATIEEMACDQLARLRAARPRGPYCLAGYCNGGLVAYEIARRLLDAGDDVPLLAMIDVPVAWSAALPAAEQDPSLIAVPDAWRHQPAVRSLWLLNRHIGAVRRYVPLPYRGPLTVLCSGTANAAHSPERGARDAWERIAPDLSFHELPGDHITSVSRHLPELAAILGERLAAVSSACGSQEASGAVSGKANR